MVATSTHSVASSAPEESRQNWSIRCRIRDDPERNGSRKEKRERGWRNSLTEPRSQGHGAALERSSPVPTGSSRLPVEQGPHPMTCPDGRTGKYGKPLTRMRPHRARRSHVRIAPKLDRICLIRQHFHRTTSLTRYSPSKQPACRSLTPRPIHGWRASFSRGSTAGRVQKIRTSEAVHRSNRAVQARRAPARSQLRNGC
jgi:hypothetical protein